MLAWVAYEEAWIGGLVTYYSLRHGPFPGYSLQKCIFHPMVYFPVYSFRNAQIPFMKGVHSQKKENVE